MTLSVIFSGASLVLCGFFFIYFTLYIKRRTERANILGDYQDEVNKLIADIDSATDRDLILVEDRINALKKLLEDVDKRLAVLTREEDRRRSSEAVYTHLGRQMKLTVQEPASEAVSRESLSEGSVLSDRAAERSAADGAGAAPVAALTEQEAATLTASVIPEKQETRASFTERAAELSRAGFAPDLIAARLGVSISEVKLAIAVSRRKA
ncbi:hypothetical protein FACS189485_11620 [Spirochaetia bacterium]|nr:hypothetical protein FACS189485_11620 [Spirochaetia bacterium]